MIKRSSYSAKVYRLKPQNPRLIRFRVHDHLQPHGQARARAPHPVLDYKHDIRQITKKRVKSTVTLLYCLSKHHNNSNKLTINIINCGLTYPLPLKWTIWLFVVVKSIPNSIFSEHHKTICPPLRDAKLIKVLESPLVFEASMKILAPFQKSWCFVFIRNLFCNAKLKSFHDVKPIPKDDEKRPKFGEIRCEGK